MKTEQKMKQYRIGEYAGYLGVTPDLLKHYEQFGLVSSVTAENGYRYYSFDQSMFLLDCFRLRGYGFSLREMGDMLREDDAQTVHQKLAEQTEELKKRIRFEQAVVKEHERVGTWLETLGQEKLVWHIEEQMEELLFLPHSRKRDFLKDERIYQVLPGWTGNMPMVKPCMQRYADAPDGLTDFYWGFCVTAAYAEESCLPVNDAVVRLPRGRAMVMNYAMDVRCGGEKPFDAAKRVMQEQQLIPNGPAYIIVLVDIRNQKNPMQCGHIVQPVK